MKGRLAPLLALFCFALFSPAAGAQESEPTLETLGVQVHTSLAALKAQSMNLTEELRGQKAIVSEYRTKLSALTASLANTNERLCDYETKLIRYEGSLKAKAKIILVLGIIFALNLLGKAAALVLKAKGLKLPELLHILW